MSSYLVTMTKEKTKWSWIDLRPLLRSPPLAAPYHHLQRHLFNFCHVHLSNAKFQQKLFREKNLKKCDEIAPKTLLLLFGTLFWFPGSKHWIEKIQEVKPYAFFFLSLYIIYILSQFYSYLLPYLVLSLSPSFSLRPMQWLLGKLISGEKIGRNILTC